MVLFILFGRFECVGYRADDAFYWLISSTGLCQLGNSRRDYELQNSSSIIADINFAIESRTCRCWFAARTTRAIMSTLKRNRRNRNCTRRGWQRAWPSSVLSLRYVLSLFRLIVQLRRREGTVVYWPIHFYLCRCLKYPFLLVQEQIANWERDARKSGNDKALKQVRGVKKHR